MCQFDGLRIAIMHAAIGAASYSPVLTAMGAHRQRFIDRSHPSRLRCWILHLRLILLVLHICCVCPKPSALLCMCGICMAVRGRYAVSCVLVGLVRGT